MERATDGASPLRLLTLKRNGVESESEAGQEGAPDFISLFGFSPGEFACVRNSIHEGFPPPRLGHLCHLRAS